MIIILEVNMFSNFYVLLFFDIITEIYIPHGIDLKLPVYCWWTSVVLLLASNERRCNLPLHDHQCSKSSYLRKSLAHSSGELWNQNLNSYTNLSNLYQLFWIILNKYCIEYVWWLTYDTKRTTLWHGVKKGSFRWYFTSKLSCTIKIHILQCHLILIGVSCLL